ncbi:MAG TPA: phosphorylase [Nostocaceae cyanobacterium]|nr:phosphorylase [Nostocaceae cyanobacterium]
MANLLEIDTIFVPQGAEYQAVCRGLSRVNGTKPTVKAVPVGVQPLQKYLQNLPQQPEKGVLLMGLCGSLNQHLAVGDVVLYQGCVYEGNFQPCCSELTTQIYSYISHNANFVKGLTSDRLISSASEKLRLGETSPADVVDMEGFAVLQFYQQIGIPVSIVRVVSDDCNHDIPDISAAISPDGSLKPLPLALGFLRQPLAATRLIRGSLQGLKVLQNLTTAIFK